MASSADQTVTDFDLAFLDAPFSTAESNKSQNARAQLQGNPVGTGNQFGDINKIQVHIPMSKYQKQRRSLGSLKKKVIAVNILVNQVGVKKVLVETIEQKLINAKEECREVSIQYKESQDLIANLQTENTKLENANKQLQVKVTEFENQIGALKSHCNQLQILAQQNATSMQGMSLERNLKINDAKVKAKNEAKAYEKKITTLETEKQKLVKLLSRLGEVISDASKLNKEDRTLLSEYNIPLATLETPVDDVTSDCHVFEDSLPSPAYETAMDADDDKLISPAMRLICEGAKESRPAEVDRDSDSGTEVVSEDTGRGSSLASSRSGKCFSSPEYFIPTNSIELLCDKQQKPQLVDAATSPATHTMQDKSTSTSLTQINTNKTVLASTQTSPTIAKSPPKTCMSHKSTSPVAFESHNKSFASIFDEPVDLECSLSSSKKQYREIATSPIIPVITVSNENNVTVHDSLPTLANDDIPVNDCLPTLSDDEVDGEEHTTEDSEIEMILTKMRLTHQLVTPIPMTPRSARAKVPRPASSVSNAHNEPSRNICPEVAQLRADNMAIHTKMSDLAKDMIFIKNLLIDTLKTGKLGDISSAVQSNDKLTKLVDHRNQKDILRATQFHEEITDLVDPQNQIDISRAIQFKDRVSDFVEPQHLNNISRAIRFDDEVTDLFDPKKQKDIPSTMKFNDRVCDLVESQNQNYMASVKDIDLPEDVGLGTDVRNENTQSGRVLKIDDSLMDLDDVVTVVIVEEDNRCNTPERLSATDEYPSCESITKPAHLHTPASKVDDSYITTAQTDRIFNKPVNPEIETTATTQVPIRRMTQTITFEQELDEHDSAAEDNYEETTEEPQKSPEAYNVITSSISPIKKARKLTKLEKLRKNLAPKSKIKYVAPPTRLRQKQIVAKKLDEAVDNNKAAYEKAVEFMNELRKTQKEKIIVTNINRVKVDKVAEDKIKANNNNNKMITSESTKNRVPNDNVSKSKRKSIPNNNNIIDNNKTINNNQMNSLPIQSDEGILRNTDSDTRKRKQIETVEQSIGDSVESNKSSSSVTTRNRSLRNISKSICDDKEMKRNEHVDSKTSDDSSKATRENRKRSSVHEPCKRILRSTCGNSFGAVNSDKPVPVHAIIETHTQAGKMATKRNGNTNKSYDSVVWDEFENNNNTTRLPKRCNDIDLNDKNMDAVENLVTPNMKPKVTDLRNKFEKHNSAERIPTRSNKRNSSLKTYDDINIFTDGNTDAVENVVTPNMKPKVTDSRNKLEKHNSAERIPTRSNKRNSSLKTYDDINMFSGGNTQTVESLVTPNMKQKVTDLRNKFEKHNSAERIPTRSNKRNDDSLLTTYDDIDIFSDGNTDIEENSSTPKKKQKVIDSRRIVNPHESILCTMMNKYGLAKLRNINPTMASSEPATAKLKEHIETTIATIADLPEDKQTASIYKFVKEMSKLSITIFTSALIKYLSEPERKTELLNKKQVMNSPGMTKQEIVLLAVVDQLKNAWRNVDYISHLLDMIEYTLFRLNQTPQFDTIESMGHFYAVLCRFRDERSRLRVFMMDAMYCLQYKAVPIVRQSLDVWMHVIPLAHLGIAKNPLVTCLVYLLHFYKCEDRYNRVQDVRNILQRKYSYKLTDWNEARLLEMIRNAVTDLRDNPHDKKMLHTALLTIAKRHGARWCHKHIVTGILLPAIEQDGGTACERAREFCVATLGPLMRPYPHDMAVNVEVVINLLTDRLERNLSPQMEEAIMSSLIYMSRHSLSRVLQVLLKWSPAKISQDMETLLRDFIQEKPVKTWQYHLSKVSLEPC